MKDLSKYKVDWPEGVSGDWSIRRFSVSDEDERLQRCRSDYFRSGRYVPTGEYTGLYHFNSVVMSDTPDEIRDHLYAIAVAHGNVLISGLGLGVVALACLKKQEVEHVTVLELSQDVINLVAPFIIERFKSKVEIIHTDALSYKPPKGTKFGMVWHDIWPNLCSDYLPEMYLLTRRYCRKADYVGCWAKEAIQEHKRNYGW